MRIALIFLLVMPGCGPLVEQSASLLDDARLGTGSTFAESLVTGHDRFDWLIYHVQDQGPWFVVLNRPDAPTADPSLKITNKRGCETVWYKEQEYIPKPNECIVVASFPDFEFNRIVRYDEFPVLSKLSLNPSYEDLEQLAAGLRRRK